MAVAILTANFRFSVSDNSQIMIAINNDTYRYRCSVFIAVAHLSVEESRVQ